MAPQIINHSNMTKTETFIYIPSLTRDNRKEVPTMNFLDKIKKAMLVVLLSLIVALPAALAYPVSYPYPSYFNYGQARMGAYTAQYQYAQGFYDYVSPPIALTRYGADYNIYNIRDAVYPEFPAVRVPNIYEPYYGYPYASYGNPVNLRYQPYGTW
jgi:hypothetical protein